MDGQRESLFLWLYSLLLFFMHIDLVLSSWEIVEMEQMFLFFNLLMVKDILSFSEEVYVSLKHPDKDFRVIRYYGSKRRYGFMEEKGMGFQLILKLPWRHFQHLLRTFDIMWKQPKEQRLSFMD